MLVLDKNEIFEICQRVDAAIARELTESIVDGTSFDMLEAHHGILPISRNCFYIRRRKVQNIIEQNVARLEEEPSGQMRIVWEQNIGNNFH